MYEDADRVLPATSPQELGTIPAERFPFVAGFAMPRLTGKPSE